MPVVEVVAEVLVCEIMKELPLASGPKLQEGIECLFVLKREDEKDSRHE